VGMELASGNGIVEVDEMKVEADTNGN